MINKPRKIVVLLILLFSALSFHAQKIEYSRDGQTLAVNWVIDFSYGEDVSQFLFYDTKSGKVRSSLNALEIPHSLIFSTDSKNLIFAERLILEKIGFNERGEPQISENQNTFDNFAIDRKNQEKINSDFLALALSPDGKTVYKMFPNFLNAYTFPDFKHQSEKSRFLELKEASEIQNEFVGISRDASIVIEVEYEGDKSALVIKETGKPDAKIELSKIEGSRDGFLRLSAVISQNNEILMLRSINDSRNHSQIAFWNLKNKTLIGTFSVPLLDKDFANQFYPLDLVAISPDGKKAAAKFEAVDENVQNVSMVAIYDIAAKRSVFIKTKKENGLRFAEAVAFSPDSKNLATLSGVLSRASFAPRVEIWNAEDGKKIRQFE